MFEVEEVARRKVDRGRERQKADLVIVLFETAIFLI